MVSPFDLPNQFAVLKLSISVAAEKARDMF
jgi:hypothetical protein